jgi:hypothetical protein
MFRHSVMTLTLLVGCGGSAVAAEFDAGAQHDRFMGAFNNRQWEGVKSVLAEDSVFHRANATEVYSGPDAIVDHFEQTIGGEWNVKFETLDSTDQFTRLHGPVHRQ